MGCCPSRSNGGAHRLGQFRGVAWAEPSHNEPRRFGPDSVCGQPQVIAGLLPGLEQQHTISPALNENPVMTIEAQPPCSGAPVGSPQRESVGTSSSPLPQKLFRLIQATAEDTLRQLSLAPQ
eukprot:RCo038099